MVNKRNIIHCLRNNDDLLVGLYLGIWAGDGTQYLDKGYRIKICCNSNNIKLIEFIQSILIQIFGKTSHVVNEARHRSLIRFKSKFIFYFVHDFLEWQKTKTHTVHLKKEESSYSNRFIRGFFLGLMLTDGYLKEKLRYNTTSKALVINILNILNKLGFSPQKFISNRTKYGWKDLHCIYLTKKESKSCLNLLDDSLNEIGCKYSFSVLKGYKENKSEPAEI